MKKKLLIINGAGASVEFGMPSVTEIDSLFSKWANDYLKLEDNIVQNLYDWVKVTNQNYLRSHSKHQYSESFENYLYIISLLESVYTENNHWLYSSNKLKPYITEKVDLPKINYFNKQIRQASSGDFSFLYSYLIDKLLEHFRGLSINLENNFQEEQKHLRVFYNKLQNNFQIGIINLNYDNTIIRNIDLETGFDLVTNHLDRDLLYKKEWNFCYHMHGSVHFDMKGGLDKTQMHKINWNKDLHSAFTSNSSGRSSIYTTEGYTIKNSSIVAGFNKSTQLLKEPFIQYYMTLDKKIYESDAILFIGYGFTDLHLNSLFEFIRFNQNKHRKVVVIDYADDDMESLHLRHDSWSEGLFQTVPLNSRELEVKAPYSVNHFKKNFKLERNSNPEHPLAIWYNGFIEACKNADKIISELA
ncbi:MAG TPA: SIR2 family protein [Salinimicrobium sp.]|nr:SIR2 family protein [Salinimicrobium sp.]